MKTLKEHNKVVEMLRNQRMKACVACDACGTEMEYVDKESITVECPECGYQGRKLRVFV